MFSGVCCGFLANEWHVDSKKATDALHFWAMRLNSLRNYSVHFYYFSSRYYPPSFNTPHTMNAMVVVPEKKRKKTWWFNAADSLLSSPDFGLYFTATKSMFLSCDDPATLCALKNVNKIKLRGVMHTLGFFLELTALMPRLGQAPMSLSIAQRENIACLNLP